MNVKQALAPLGNLSVVVVSISYGLLHTLAALFAMLGTLVPVSVYAALAGLLALVLRGLLWLSTWRYAYTVLRSIAQGHRELPAPDLDSLNPLARLRLVVHFVALPLIIGALVSLDPGPALVRWLAIVLLAAAIPASAAVMAFTGNLALALSPWHLAGVIGRLGIGYARLLGFCLLVAAALAAVRALPLPLVPGMLAANTLDVWACLGVFALTGALFREHRAEFDIPGELESEEERAERECRRRRQLALDRAYASFRSGLQREGFVEVDALLAFEAHSLSVYEWLFGRMAAWDAKAPALEIGTRYVDRLLADGEIHDALDVFARCRRMSERFEVRTESARTLAEYARSIGRHAHADDLEACAAQFTQKS